MKKLVLILSFAALLTSCVASVAPEGTVIGPPLPETVILPGPDYPYYYYGGYYYLYDRDRWYYSRSRRGPYNHLPRERYPRITRFRDPRDYREGRPAPEPRVRRPGHAPPPPPSEDQGPPYIIRH